MMRFPGGKLLHEWDLAVHRLSMNDLLRSCQQVGLTGYMELQFPDAVAMVLYYMGSEVNAMYREGPTGASGEAAIERLRVHLQHAPVGVVTVHELPLDMAHLLRGMTNRRRLAEPVSGREGLTCLLARLEQEKHTGTLELHAPAGSGMLLLVGGRLSNVYWEAADHTTFERDAARRRLERSLEAGAADAFVASFSRDSWIQRQEVQSPVPPRTFVSPAAGSSVAAEVASEEDSLRIDVLEDLSAQVPAAFYVAVVDLPTGAVLAEKYRGPEALQAGLLPKRLAALLLHLKREVEADDHELEALTLTAGKVTAQVAVVPEAREAVAVVADRAQPTALVGVALARAAQVYGDRLRPRKAPPGEA